MDEFKTYTPQKISLKKKRYHVFLSFRGKDTRKYLVADLFEWLRVRGVHVFIDSNRIHKGQTIGLTLKQAIEETDICIPIFSRNFAQSRWCLLEVTEMLKSKGLVIPLFCGVEPADVKYAEIRPMYGEAFADHRRKRREKRETIDEWKEALSKVASLSGWTTEKSDRYEIKFILDVVSDVINTLNIVPLDVPRFPFGLKERMDAVIKLLKIEDRNRVVTVGIWGAPGAGKSTLARAIYNDIFGKFDVCTFVLDIAAYGQHVDGLCKLQKQLLRDLLKRKSKECKINNVYHGKAILEGHLQSIRGLVILDNVANREQLEMLAVESLGKGSRIIVTTRDKSILNVAEDQIYAVQELGKEEALHLFISHAFLKACPDKEYKDLSEKIVDACGGLPFSLEVLGSFLHRRKDIRCWNEVLGQLQSATFDGIYRMPKIIYQDLSAEEKQIFLDIACFLVGQEQEAAISFWEDLNLNPHNNLSNLVLKSVVKIDYQQDPIISMQAHWINLGRAIVANESRDPSKRSRLWNPEEAYHVLHQRRGLESVQSISLSGVEKSLKAENMESTKNLQLFWLGDNTIEGDLKPLSSNWRWFRWNSCPLSSLPSEWDMEHLDILDLSGTTEVPSQIKQIWNRESANKHLKNLKFLLLRQCIHLETLPDFSKYTRLLRIDLENCSGLGEIPQSIGLLLQLKCLNLCGCKNLSRLPDSICKLSSLKKLYMNGCSSIAEMPDMFNQMSSLEKLHMNGCSAIGTLPSTFGQFRALKELDLGGLRLIKELPPFQSGCCLQKLVLSGCESLRKLPASIGNLTRLSYLEMNKCRTVPDLPEQFGKLESLKQLFLNECFRLNKLPESFGNLRKITTLELKETHCLAKLPENFSKLQSLVRFDARFSQLICLPAGMGDLSSLEILNLQNTLIKTLPDTLNQLKKLKILILNQCKRLSELPALPEALDLFKAQDCEEIKRVVRMSDMRNLTVMDLRNCKGLEELPVLSSLHSLEKIDLRGCENIKNIADLGLGRLKNLQSLYLSKSDRIGFNLRQVVEDMPLFQRSTAKMMQDHVALESNCFKDIVSFPLERNSRCEGLLLFFQLKVHCKGSMEIVFVIDEEETIKGTTVDTEGGEQFILIFRAKHPVIVALDKAQNLCVRAKGEGIPIKHAEVRVCNEIQEADSENRMSNRGMSEAESIMDEDGLSRYMFSSPPFSYSTGVFFVGLIVTHICFLRYLSAT